MRGQCTLECALETFQLALCAMDAANQRLLGRRALRCLNAEYDVLIRLLNDVQSCKHHALVLQHGLSHHATGGVTLSLKTKRLGGHGGLKRCTLQSGCDTYSWNNFQITKRQIN